jgi:hypothetical protein
MRYSQASRCGTPSKANIVEARQIYKFINKPTCYSLQKHDDKRTKKPSVIFKVKRCTRNQPTDEFIAAMAKIRFLKHVDPTIFNWALCCLKVPFQIADVFLDILYFYSITRGTRKEREKSREYEYLAQIVTVVARAGHGPVLDHELRNFCWKHNIYVHPKLLLERDNIIMSGFTLTHAFFTIMPEDNDIFNVEGRIKM